MQHSRESSSQGELEGKVVEAQAFLLSYESRLHSMNVYWNYLVLLNNMGAFSTVITRSMILVSMSWQFKKIKTLVEGLGGIF